MKYKIWVTLSCLIICGCAVGPDYKKPSLPLPETYKEAPKGWKYATPNDECDRGPWWEIFHDPKLNELVQESNVHNQNIAIALHQYEQSKAIVQEAQAAFFPTLSGGGSVIRSQQSSRANVQTTNSKTKAPALTNYIVSLTGSWEPDLWGGVRRNVESATAQKEASLAQLKLVQLSTQALLAIYYFELRGLDVNQQLLNRSVDSLKKILDITKNRYKAGTAGREDVLQAESQLKSMEANAIDNGILRAQYEHAIAVLIGQTPSTFSLTSHPLNATLTSNAPIIPLEFPSDLLERRPDVAQAERLMAAANAQIGVAVAAYFPSLTLSGLYGYNSTILSQLFTSPARFWSIGAQLVETIFDGGLRTAKVAAAKAAYYQNVANYKQVVLTAFQDVEDLLVSLRLLNEEEKVQQEAVNAAQHSLQILMNQYKAGTVATLDVLNAALNADIADRALNAVVYRKMTSTVGLIRALGGGIY